MNEDLTLDLEILNERHLRSVDKFFRMFAGAASRITKFHGEIIYLDIQIDDRLKIPLEQITRNIATSWHTESDLSGATGYVAHIYKSLHPSGFVFSVNTPSEEAIERINGIATDYPDVMLRIISESFQVEGER